MVFQHTKTHGVEYELASSCGLWMSDELRGYVEEEFMGNWEAKSRSPRFSNAWRSRCTFWIESQSRSATTTRIGMANVASQTPMPTICDSFPPLTFDQGKSPHSLPHSVSHSCERESYYAPLRPHRIPITWPNSKLQQQLVSRCGKYRTLVVASFLSAIRVVRQVFQPYDPLRSFTGCTRYTLIYVVWNLYSSILSFRVNAIVPRPLVWRVTQIK